MSSITNTVDEWPTWTEVFETLLFRAGYNTTLVVVGTTLLGIAAGIVGVFALLRKRALMSDALSHATLPGIALAYYVVTKLGFDGRSLPTLLFGASATGVLGIVCVQLILRHSRLREDAAIGIVLSVFFGAGIVMLSIVQNMQAGNAAGLNRFIYGQTAAMSFSDAILMSSIAAIAIFATFLLCKEFSVVCFNDAFARAQGLPVTLLDLLMMTLVVLVTVAGLQAVGLILVVAMLIIPAVSARFWTERLWLLLVLAGVIGGLSGYCGSTVSALLPRKPAGAVIVLTSGILFAVSMLAAPSRGLVAAILRNMMMRIRIAGDHILEFGYQRQRPATQQTLTRADLDQLAHYRAWPGWLRSVILLSLRIQGRLKPISRGHWVLTPEGQADGARISRNHRLWEQYLISYADIAPSHVDWSVDQVEHVLSESLIAELEHALTLRGIVISNDAPHSAGTMS